MLKKYVIIVLCLVSYHADLLSARKKIKSVIQKTASAKPHEISKLEQLTTLSKISETINRVGPLQEYVVAVPEFITITKNDIEKFLIKTQSPHLQKKSALRRSRATSVLEHIHGLWRKVLISIRRENKPNEQTYELLAQIRQSIGDAFEHNFVQSSAALATFAQKARSYALPLIVRFSHKLHIDELKSIYPIDASEINSVIATMVKSYFYDEVIEKRIKQNALDDLLPEIVIQSFIMPEKDEEPIVSGLSCSYDTEGHAIDIHRIEAVYGQHAGLKDPTITKDLFYIYNNTVYPIIRKKVHRLDAALGTKDLHPTTNLPEEIQEAPTLDIAAGCC